MDPFGFSPEQYTAAASWTSALILAGSLVFARAQIREARRLRREQTRPWVVVRFDPGFIFGIIIENIGSTVAQNITINFDPPLTSTWKRPWGWEESSLLSEGLPMLAPNDKIRFHFDTFTDRLEAELPMVYEVRTSYQDSTGTTFPVDIYRLDLNLYIGASREPKGMPELVAELENIRRELAKWTDGLHGLKVHNVDRAAWKRVSDRPWRINKAMRIRSESGNREFLAHLIRQCRLRFGLYRHGP